MVARGSGPGQWGVPLQGTSFGGDKNGLELDSGAGCTAL